MNVKLRVLSIGVVFFAAQSLSAQQDSTKVQNIDEVVVVGYGTQKKSDVTANLASVKGTVIADKPVQTFDQALGGRATGVQITVPSGVLNAAPVFRIRGVNSISLSSYPLIVIDGVPTFTGNWSSTDSASNPLASINPSDIESIDIAKDAAATAIYGSRAANGVVFITTKKGRSGKPRVSYNTWMSFASPFRLPEVLGAEDYVRFKNMAVANNPTASAIKFSTALDANGRIIDTDWSKVIYRTGASNSHNINIAGGTEGLSYYFSAGYTKQEGIIRKNDFQRMNMLMNIEGKLSKSLTVGGKLAYSNEQNNAAANSGSISGGAFATGGLGRLQFVLPSTISPFNNNGTYNINGSAIGSSPQIAGISSLGYYNPQFLLDNNRSNSENNHIQSNIFVQLKPFSWLTGRTSYGIDYMMIDNDLYWSPRSGDGFSYGGYAFGLFDKAKMSVWTNTLQADKSFADHNLSLLVGNEQTWNYYSSYGIQRDKVADPEYDVVQAGFVNNNPIGMGKSQNYLVSFFGRLNYNFANKYYLSGNIRQDEYSALGEKKGVFWGASAGWEIAKEGFWNSMGADKVFSSFKLRGSYGKGGNIGGLGNYASNYLYSSGLYGGLSTLQFSQVGNSKLRWETSDKMDVGVNFGLLNNRVTGEVSYYHNKINDLILYVQQAPSVGFPVDANSIPTSQPMNIGSMYNKGWEFDLKANILEESDFSWNAGFNFTMNENEVTALAPGMDKLTMPTSNLETVNQSMPGYSIGYIFAVRTAGVDPGTGKRIFINKNGEKVYYTYYAPTGTFNWSYDPEGKNRAAAVSIADGVMYGNTQPKIFGGFDNTFKYKGFELNTLFTFQAGNYIYYGSNAGLHDQRWWNNHVDVLTDAWMNPGDTGKKYARPVFNDNVSNGSAFPLDINVFKGDFIKLKNLTFAYNFSRNTIEPLNLTSLRLYVGGQNLAIFTKYPGPDPEVSSNGNSTLAPGVDRNTVGNARTFLVGLNVGF